MGGMDQDLNQSGMKMDLKPGKSNLLDITLVPDSIVIIQGNSKEKVKQNLANIIEKAVHMRQEKIFYNVEFRFMLEGNIKLVFDISDSNSAQIKLKLFETNEQ